ncbi:MAG: hypothetical protein A2Z27_01705 [candidate division Zixibacteria bacterium RBG_16_50_21]|nr:MAG: hypothetical protein A2Z27_01705 [candidate division Zixibacteria bacterium RBG_16_50_21]
MPSVISIILPVFNGAETLDRAVQSVQEQTLQEWELVCIDDGSIDSSESIIQRLAVGDPRIKLLRQKHQGADKARNAGFTETRGEIITFLDADDWYEPDHLMAHLRHFNSHPEAEVVIGRARVLGDPYVPDINNPSRLVHLDHCIVQGTLFVRREAMKHLWPMPDVNYGSDFLLYQEILKKGFAVHHVCQQSYVYDRRAWRSLTKDIARRFGSQLAPEIG